MHAFYRIWPIFMLFIAFLLHSGLCQAKENRTTEEIEVKAAAELIKKKPDEIIILDVRTPGEFREEHIADAQNMDFFGGGFDHDIRSLPKDRAILVYCRSGKRSYGAAESLQEAGYNKVLHMHEGLEAWKKAGLPVEKDKTPNNEKEGEKEVSAPASK